MNIISKIIGWFKGKLSDGNTCDIDDLCHKLKPCQNDGTCIPSEGGYKCQCPLGWKGKNCTDHSNPCDGKNIQILKINNINY